MSEVFPLFPPTSKPAWLYASVTVVMLLLGLLFIWLGWSSRQTRFEVSPAGLRLHGEFYGRLVPAEKLQLDQARIIDFSASPEYRPKWRTLGTALGQYRAGWFRLRNGQKALLYLSSNRQVTVIPTTENYLILLSVAEPKQFLERLRAVAGRR